MDKLPEKHPHIRAAMTPFPLSIEVDASLDEAEAAMAEHQIRHLPVTEGGELTGILSHRDLQVLKASIDRKEWETITIAPAVVRYPFVVDSLEPIQNVVAEMARRHIGSALVTHEGKLAGIFTVTDACSYLAELLRCIYDREDGIA